MTKADKWQTFTNHIDELNTIRSVIGLLTWDQQTHMPTQGAKKRSVEIAYLSSLSHEKITSQACEDILNNASMAANGDAIKTKAVEEAIKHRNRSKCIPTDLVSALSSAKSVAVSKWAEAKEQNDYKIFSPHLDEVLNLTRQYASCHGQAESLYDNLLEDYDPGMTVQKLNPMFKRLKEELVPFVSDRIQNVQAADLHLQLSNQSLTEINQLVISQLGFEMTKGKLDQSAHPFTCGLSPNDVRLTTHNNENDLLGTLSGTIHECGHGLYEQGLPIHWRSIGLCEAAGCGIHESQSRFYENIIGKSYPFYKWLAPQINNRCEGVELTADILFGAANKVKRSLVRIMSDECTYNLHIIVRYELEKLLFEGNLKAIDLPKAWDDSYEEVVGVRPQSISKGVLQDIHWSMGLIGYFPSYTIGNLYSASFKAQMQIDLPNMWHDIEHGNFSGPLNWLRKHVHQHGKSMTQEAILMQAVGQRDQVTDLMTHFKERQAICDNIA